MNIIYYLAVLKESYYLFLFATSLTPVMNLPELPLFEGLVCIKPSLTQFESVTLEHTLKNEIRESKKWLDREYDESVYNRDLEKRIELINWVLENMKNPGVEICGLIESKMNEIILVINQTYSILEADKLHSELRILDWILYQVCVNEK